MDISAMVAEGIEAIESNKFNEALNIAASLQREAPKQAVGYHLEGLAQQSLLQWDLSITAFNKAIEQSPYDPNLFNFRGFAYMNLGNMKQAELDFKEAISLEDFEPAHRNYVLWLILSDKSQDAIDYLTKRIQAKRSDPENYILMGDLMVRAGFADKAESYFDAAKKLQGN